MSTIDLRCRPCEIPINQTIQHYYHSSTPSDTDILVRGAMICGLLSFELKVYTWQRNSKTAEEILHKCVFFFFFSSTYRTLMTYKTHHWKTLITLQLNPNLSSGTVAENSVYTEMCQHQGRTQTLLLTEINHSFSWTCYRSCRYFSQSLSLGGIKELWLKLSTKYSSFSGWRLIRTPQTGLSSPNNTQLLSYPNHKLHFYHFLEKYFTPFIIHVTLVPACSVSLTKLKLGC